MESKRKRCEWDQVGDIGRHAGGIVRRRMPTKPNRAARIYGTDTLATKWDSGKRDENAKVDVRSDTQRQYMERTLTRDNESGTGFQEDHWKNVELVKSCDEER